MAYVRDTEENETAPVQRKFVRTPQTSAQRVKLTKYKTSSLRKDSSIIERDLVLEKSFGIKKINFYYYVEECGDIKIVGELFASTPLKKDFCFICTLYDEDGDIIESEENRSYGSGLVTSYIKTESYFDGFPFSFTFFNPKAVDKIKIVPALSY